MADTYRTLSALQTLLADNTAGAISAQDLRDALVSLAGDRVATCYVSSSSATTISVAGTYYKAAGTTSPVETSSVWTHTNNRFTYTGTPTAKVLIQATIGMTCASSNQVLGFRIAKNGSVAGTNAVASTIRRKVGTGTDVGALSIQAIHSMATNDYVEVFCTNETSTGAVTVDNMTLRVQVILD